MQLYRHYKTDGTLLYIGISVNVAARLAGHKTHSKWFKDIATIKIEHFDNPSDARKAEKAAIISEKPLFNVIYGNNPRNESGFFGIHELAAVLEIPAGVIRAEAMKNRFPIPPTCLKPYKWAKTQVYGHIELNPEAVAKLDELRLRCK